MPQLEAIGQQFGPTPPYEVSREKLREFADALGDPNPAYRDADAARALGYADVIAPPTFAIVLTLNPVVAALGDNADISQVVHSDQRFVHARPIVAGDVLRTLVTIEDVRTMAGNLVVATRADVSTAAGEHVVTGHTSIVVRGETL
jgi:acyl dehydratase